MSELPNYLTVTQEELGCDAEVCVQIVGDAAELAREMATAMLGVIQRAQQQARQATLIVPVGPVDQFPVLAQLINEQRVDCREVMLINMDEYLDDDDQWVDIEHPLSFRGYMDRAFYDCVDGDLAPRSENRVFPDPCRVDGLPAMIDQRGGVDACFGGIGINGHMAFNEPPEPGETISAESFAQLPTRCLDLSRETRTINSVTVGGEITVIPRRAVTVGMREILDSRCLRFYCNRPWQSSVVRRVLHGPISAACPASMMRSHHDAQLTLTDLVAELPNIRLR